MTENGINKDYSCMDDYDPNSILPDEALKIIFNKISATTETESIPIRESLGRVLATNITSEINVPSGRNSAMDGYAINAVDLPFNGKISLKIIGSSFAGKPSNIKIKKGECIRIMTGAIMPDGSDTVVMQEAVERSGDTIALGIETKAGNNVREAGEDLAIGDLVLEKGIKVTPADIGLLASLGLAKVTVYRKIRVAFFSTGDELRSVGDKLDNGAIYDSNRYTLYGMLKRLGVDIIDMGVVKDNRKLMDKALSDAKGKSDVLITSGGVSVGEADYVKESLLKYGEVDFWKVAMKPGRPFTFGKLDSTYFFGLPGNPVSVMVTFYQFVQPALKRIIGEKATSPMLLKVPCISKLKKRPGRVEYQRGILECDDTGRMTVRKTGAQGSGILRSMADANCFIVLSLENNGVSPEDLVDVQLFHGLV
jgi:molybdopterin molybdotransferase